MKIQGMFSDSTTFRKKEMPVLLSNTKHLYSSHKFAVKDQFLKLSSEDSSAPLEFRNLNGSVFKKLLRIPQNPKKLNSVDKDCLKKRTKTEDHLALTNGKQA